MVDTPSSLLPFLRDIGAKPSRSLSQNFLIDKNIIKKIVASANISSNDLILEIGPGPGALTKEIASKSSNLIAVEKDRTFAGYLARHEPQISVYEDDFLTFPLRKILSPKNQKAKVIANLPYGITSPVIAKLLDNFDLFSDITVMVQYEMAKRLTAVKSSKNYSAFTIFTNFYSDIKFLFGISPNCFYPKPKVQSAIIQMKVKNPPGDIDRKGFHLFVRKTFGQRRKKLTTSLKSYCLSANIPLEKIEKALLSLRINMDSRPENLSCSDFYLLYKELTQLKT